MNDLCVNESSWTESSSFLEVSLFTKLLFINVVDLHNLEHDIYYISIDY